MSRQAAIVIDMLNPYDHEDADALAAQARSRIEPVQQLVQAAHDAGRQLIYVNDCYEDYTATSKDVVAAALEGKHPELVEPILPPEGTPFMLKVRHSAFYSTSLDHFLRHEGVDTIVLAGQVTEQCILYTALDAYVRGFTLRIARDAVVPIEEDLGDAALRMAEGNMRARLVDAADAFAD